MKIPLVEMHSRVTSNPSLVLVKCTHLYIGTENQMITFDTHPTNYKLDCDPVEETPGEIWAVLEDLDYTPA